MLIRSISSLLVVMVLAAACSESKPTPPQDAGAEVVRGTDSDAAPSDASDAADGADTPVGGDARDGDALPTDVSSDYGTLVDGWPSRDSPNQCDPPSCKAHPGFSCWVADGDAESWTACCMMHEGRIRCFERPAD